MSKKDPDELSKNGILTNRAMDYLAYLLKAYTEVYETVNWDSRLTYERRKEAIKEVKKAAKKLKKGKGRDLLDMEILARYAPSIESDALHYEKKMDKEDEIIGLQS